MVKNLNRCLGGTFNHCIALLSRLQVYFVETSTVGGARMKTPKNLDEKKLLRNKRISFLNQCIWSIDAEPSHHLLLHL